MCLGLEIASLSPFPQAVPRGLGSDWGWELRVVGALN